MGKNVKRTDIRLRLFNIAALITLLSILAGCGTPAAPAGQEASPASASAAASTEAQTSAPASASAAASASSAEAQPSAAASAEASPASSQAAATETSAASGAAQPLADVPREQTLIMDILGGAVTGPDLQNPFSVSVNLGAGLHQVVMESLFYLNYENGELIPWLAKSYDQNADGNEFTIHLREGVKWSDGQPLTADDVVFTLNMLKQNAPELSSSEDIKKWVKDVQAVDPQTVKITLTEPNQRWVRNTFGVHLYTAVPIVPKHIWEQQDPKTFRNFDLAKGWPIFTGPYRLMKATQNEFIYDRRDDWWGAQTGFHELPAPKRIVFTNSGPEERRAAALVNHDIDIIAQLGIGAYETAKAQNPAIVSWREDKPYGWLDACPHYLELNTMAAPWTDAEMRRGLAYAIDTTRYANVTTEGAGLPARFIFPAYPQLDAILDKNKDLFDKYEIGQFSLEKAAQIFEGKGYKKGSDGIYASSDGKRLEVRLVMLTPEAGGALWGLGTTALTDFMQKAGIAVNARSVDFNAFDQAVATGDFDAHVQWSCGSVVDPYPTMDNWHKRHVVPIGERASSNTARWSNDEYSKLVDQMASLAPDDPKIEPLFRQALDIWLQERPGIPLAQQPWIVAYDQTYWTNAPTAKNNYFQPPTWWMSTLMVVMNLKPAQ